MYHFYYDESEHSRKINYDTVSAGNYYDNFVSVIVGWSKEKEKAIFERYMSFESKYAERKDKNGELKSKTLKKNQFEFGIASLNKQNVQFVGDFLSLFDREIHLYFSVASKIEYLVLQLFSGYENDLHIDADALKYSITKALVTYRPEKVIKCIYVSSETFVEALKDFFRERIEFNKRNIKLKKYENQTFEEILYCLEKVSVTSELHWDYHNFTGFKKYLEEEKIVDYTLVLDKEGEVDQKSKTLQAAHQMGLNNTVEIDSLNSYGIRMADMMVGILTKLLKSLCDSLRYHSLEEGIEKKVLDAKWFQVDEGQLCLYKKLYRIICEWDNAWYKSYAGIYSDDLLAFVALLNYMNHFESVKQISDKGFRMQGEYFNSYLCKQLTDYFMRRRLKLEMKPSADFSGDFFLNQQGAKVYFDIEQQPVFPISEGHHVFTVLSVGMNKRGVPLCTIQENSGNICYRMPQELSDWVSCLIGLANEGISLFPGQVLFSKVNGRYCADIL